MKIWYTYRLMRFWFVFQLNSTSVSELSFWMANISELLNFLRQDLDLSLLTADIQEDFAKTVQFSFRQVMFLRFSACLESIKKFREESYRAWQY